MATPRTALAIATLGATVICSCVTPLKGPKPTYTVRPINDSAGWTISPFGGTPLLERRFRERKYEIRVSLTFDDDAQYTSQVKLRPPHPLRLDICGLRKGTGSIERIRFDASPIVLYEGSNNLVGRSIPSYASLTASQRICSRWEFDARVNDNWPGFRFQLRLGTFSDQGDAIPIPPIEIAVSYERMFECVGINCPVMH